MNGPVRLLADTQIVVWYVTNPERLTESAIRAIDSATARDEAVGVLAFARRDDLRGREVLKLHVVIAVAADRHSTAGIGFIYLPLITTAIAAAAAGLFPHRPSATTSA